ncbi:ABC transporter substrate-binding protein [Magnetospirillum molischianum]|uniref:Amino acid ABC transporter substrate-binding protein, PAAT family (TC 3.A.1.3.-) n=1 Tax=Magnetospirillum molischianum DSM 120 TaxID=1150626 RepID=H8FPE5_MAGML|nr:ABC transporter substrate-binding protein [Magnetospirillum molischianum]CCG40233.1 Amino acid ABC transporter substrate-binding protein, PAAT family (TC 3.A.1.3.-) [Magnetospirillum molischianum DSM 120]
MFRKIPHIIAAAFLFVSGAAQADQLGDIRKAGVLRVAVFDSNPPFGFVDEKTHALEGYDIDFAKAFAEKIGVKLELVPTNPANRIPVLQSGKADLIVADLTITPERGKVVAFSTPYFVTGQQFLVTTDAPGKLEDYAKARIGAVKGTTGEQAAKARFPEARVLSYDDIPLAFAALRNGSVQAITQDAEILAGLLAEAPDKSKYKILPELLSRELIGVAIKKDEKALLTEVNTILSDLENNGQAEKIFEQWFGAKSKAPGARNFKIGAP